MGENTPISWAKHTVNFWIGCTKVSPACDFCYAERDWAIRYKRVIWGAHGDRSPTLTPLAKMRKLARSARERGVRETVFINSLSDWADNHKSIDPRWRGEIFQAARECPELILLLLTKRPQNVVRFLPPDWGDGYPNVWLGTTVENQEEADRRIPILLSTPATIRFLSCEPLLGPVDLNNWIGVHHHPDNVDSPQLREMTRRAREALGPTIDWVITGGESGPKARPTHPDWFRSLRDQCAAAGVKYHHKQNGEWAPGENAQIFKGYRNVAWWFGGEWRFDRMNMAKGDDMHRDDEPTVYRVGIQNSGRLLDGVLHDARPEIAA